MDRHIVPGIEAKHAAEAHREDLKIQDEYGCRCMTYWVDEERGYAFCLIDAPNIKAVHEMHNRAHGLIPHEIIQVNSHVIEAFMGRMEDPIGWNDPDDPTLKVFNDPAFRVILVAQITDQYLLQHRLGKEKAGDLISLHNDIIRNQIKQFEGSEVELGGSDFIVSFVSVSQAIQCAQAILTSLHIATEMLGFKIAIHAGIPVTKNNEIFGDVIQLARGLCSFDIENRTFITSVIRELSRSEHHTIFDTSKTRFTSSTEESFLELLFQVLNDFYSEANFGVPDFGSKMSMSKSKLYRTCTTVLDKSPNSILRDFRLNKSLDFLKSGLNISQSSFQSGFSSPSYFSKCFQERFELLPLQYQKQVTDS